jgi:hypothetical protein
MHWPPRKSKKAAVWSPFFAAQFFLGQCLLINLKYFQNLIPATYKPQCLVTAGFDVMIVVIMRNTFLCLALLWFGKSLAIQNKTLHPH